MVTATLKPKSIYQCPESELVEIKTSRIIMTSSETGGVEIDDI